jgi:putative hydrolase of the HAD superfamily
MDAVILDVGGVLLVPHCESVRSAFELFGITLDANAAERAHYHGIRAMDDADDEEAARHAYLVGYAESAGVPEDQRDEALKRMYEAWSQPTIEVWSQHVRGSLEGLKQLERLKVKLGIVSNADGTIEEQLKRREICQVGEGLGVPVLAIIDSTVVGVSKPAVEIFRHALDPLGVEPERAMYVGDTVRYDVRGARAAGLQPIHFDPYELCSQRDDHAHIITLSDVVTRLNGQRW